MAPYPSLTGTKPAITMASMKATLRMQVMSGNSKAVLRAGMVITDEPGIYLPDRFGVRIEDMLLVTQEGCENFVSLPKDLIIL